MDANNLSLLMGERLKEERTERGLSHSALKKALFEKYGVEISKDSLVNYEVTSQYHTKRFKNNGMRVEYLRYLADFYGVSADWLLGLSSARVTKAETSGVSEYVGLSSDTIDNLHRLVEEKQVERLRILNYLFENEMIFSLLEEIENIRSMQAGLRPYYSSEDKTQIELFKEIEETFQEAGINEFQLIDNEDMESVLKAQLTESFHLAMQEALFDFRGGLNNRPRTTVSFSLSFNKKQEIHKKVFDFISRYIESQQDISDKIGENEE